MILPDLTPYKEIFEVLKPYFFICKDHKTVLHLLNREFEDIEWSLSEEIGEIDNEGNIVEVIDAYFDPISLTMSICCGEAFYSFLRDEEEQDRIIKIALSMIGHELVHKIQINRRLKDLEYYKKGKAREYFAKPEEVAGYGWQIAQELRDYFDKHQAIQLIKFDHKTASEITTALGVYSLVFKKTDKPFKRLLKTVTACLENMDE